MTDGAASVVAAVESHIKNPFPPSSSFSFRSAAAAVSYSLLSMSSTSYSYIQSIFFSFPPLVFYSSSFLLLFLCVCVVRRLGIFQDEWVGSIFLTSLSNRFLIDTTTIVVLFFVSFPCPWSNSN